MEAVLTDCLISSTTNVLYLRTPKTAEMSHYTLRAHEVKAPVSQLRNPDPITP
jgi:hypothetical protein